MSRQPQHSMFALALLGTGSLTNPWTDLVHGWRSLFNFLEIQNTFFSNRDIEFRRKNRACWLAR